LKFFFFQNRNFIFFKIDILFFPIFIWFCPIFPDFNFFFKIEILFLFFQNRYFILKYIQIYFYFIFFRTLIMNIILNIKYMYYGIADVIWHASLNLNRWVHRGVPTSVSRVSYSLWIEARPQRSVPYYIRCVIVYKSFCWPLMSTPNTGPDTDHTIRNATGHYLLLEGSLSKVNFQII